MLENDSRSMALTGPPPGAALNRIALFDNVRASILKTLDTASSHPVEDRHATAQCRLPTCAGALRGLGRVVADVGHDVGPDLWLMARDARSFELGPLFSGTTGRRAALSLLAGEGIAHGHVRRRLPIHELG